MVSSTVLTHGVQNAAMQQDTQTTPSPTFSGMPVEVIGYCLDYLPLNEWPNVVQVNRVCRRLIQGMLSDFRYALEKGEAQIIRVGEEGERNTEHNVSYMPMPADVPREIKKLIKGMIGIESLPEELVLHIFGFLPSKDQGLASGVCQQWRDIAADGTLLTPSYLEDRYPSLQVLDEKICETHCGALGVDFKRAPPLERKMIAELDRLHGSLKIERNAGVTLAFLPSGLTFNLLIQHYPDKFRTVWDRVLTAFGDMPAKEGWFVLTNGLIEDTRRLSMDRQDELVRGMGGDIPGLLELTWVALLTHMNSPAEAPTYLYGKSPVTYSRVLGQIGKFTLAAGSFDASGLAINVYISPTSTFRALNHGIGAEWRL